MPMKRTVLGPPSLIFSTDLNLYSHTKSRIRKLIWLKTYHIFISFFRSVFSQIVQLYRAEGWHKEGKKYFWLREGEISFLHSSSMLRLAKSGYGDIS